MDNGGSGDYERAGVVSSFVNAYMILTARCEILKMQWSLFLCACACEYGDECYPIELSLIALNHKTRTLRFHLCCYLENMLHSILCVVLVSGSKNPVVLWSTKESVNPFD